MSVAAVFFLLAACFSLFQYQREKDFKVSIMQLKMQNLAYSLMQTLGKDIATNPERFYACVDSICGSNEARVTVITPDGTVLLDNLWRNADGFDNHAKRKEVKEALRHGTGYDIKRISKTLGVPYFYSATHFKDKGVIIRVALPHDTHLTSSLEPDYSYLIFAIFITPFLGIALYRNTSRIGKHIRLLRRFALKAERGETLDNELQARIPNDELGDISRTIMVLYSKLKNSEEDKVRMKRQLTQNAAHELKTPAASIQGFLETVLSNPEMDDERKNIFLERCYAQSVRMSNLLLDMAALTKLDETTRIADRSEVKLKPLIESVISDTSLQLEEHGMSVTTDVPDDATLACDAHLLYSIFRNLIDNSIAHAIGASSIRIVCRRLLTKDGDAATVCEDLGKTYEFTVTDNGCGVDAKHLALLFERFYRVDKGRSRKLGGTGLGLAIVKNAVLLHGGSISAEPAEGGGLTIRFTLKA